jgi:acetylglutamate kinase
LLKSTTDKNQLEPTKRKKELLYVIKIGGNIVDNEQRLTEFLKSFALVPARKILVHGGGISATQLADKLGVEQKMVEGRRITDAETLRIITMVYAGSINKNIVAKLQAAGCNALGLSGADGNIILAHKRTHTSIDYGFAGDIDLVNAELLRKLLDLDLALVVAPVTHDHLGQLLNTNADTIAQELAKALSSFFEVSLIYSFEKNGVLLDAGDDSTLIPALDATYYHQLKNEKKIFAGMIPKLDNAFLALRSGVKSVTIGRAEQLAGLINHSAGTTITNE